MYLSYIYKNPVILSLFKIVALNFTMYILTILTCSLKMMSLEKKLFKAQSSLNSVSMNLFFTIKDYSFLL